MTADALTVEQVREGLSAHGIKLDSRDSECSCPVCGGLMTLRVTQNGDGAHVECSAGCHEQAILGVVQAGRRILERATAHDPLQLVRDRLGIPDLTSVVKHGHLGDSYELRRADGSAVELGDVLALQNQTAVRARIQAGTRRLPPRMKAVEWDAVVQAIEDAAEEIDNVATDAEEARAWLAGYLRYHRGDRVDATDSAVLYGRLGDQERDEPFIDTDGRLHIRLEQFALWVNRHSAQRMTTRALSLRLARGLEFAPQRLAARHGNDVRKARYWVSPRGFELNT